MILVACLYLVVGVVGFTYHFHELLTLQNDAIWVELTESAAIVCGIFMLRRQNWARWLAVAWIVFHVTLSAFRSFQEFAIHCLFGVVIAWVLFDPRATRHFHPARIQPR